MDLQRTHMWSNRKQKQLKLLNFPSFPFLINQTKSGNYWWVHQHSEIQNSHCKHKAKICELLMNIISLSRFYIQTRSKSTTNKEVSLNCYLNILTIFYEPNIMFLSNQSKNSIPLHRKVIRSMICISNYIFIHHSSSRQAETLELESQAVNKQRLKIKQWMYQTKQLTLGESEMRVLILPDLVEI